MAVISIEGMEFYAYHGCFKEEAVIGTHFKVDCFMTTDTTKAQQTDDLEQTVNYLTVYQLIKKEMQQRSNLLEHVAERILKALTSYYRQVEKASVKVMKMNPPLGGQMKFVSVELSTDDLK